MTVSASGLVTSVHACGTAGGKLAVSEVVGAGGTVVGGTVAWGVAFFELLPHAGNKSAQPAQRHAIAKRFIWVTPFHWPASSRRDTRERSAHLSTRRVETLSVAGSTSGRAITGLLFDRSSRVLTT